MNTHFYDIESLDNVFTLCNFKPETNSIDVYYLCDNAVLTAIPDFKEQLLQRIYKRNHNFNGTIELYDLRYEPANQHMFKEFGLSDAYLINDPKSVSSYPDEFRLVCDSDDIYDENKHAYLLGYNSYNYDTTMLALYGHEAYPLETTANQNGQRIMKPTFRCTSAKIMREYNDDLFSPRFKDNMPTRLTQSYDIKTKRWSDTNYSDTRWRIRKNMMLSGRHIDVARLNEKQSKVGLKRILGMLGYQILESDKLDKNQSHINNTDELLELIAYNVSDIVNLEKVFNHKVYYGQFTLKKELLKTYPELVYDRIPNTYKPDIRPEKVRRDRMNIDSSSAQLATKSLCPYDHLSDIPAVSFLYPSKEKSEELGIPQVNVLEESKKFFYSHFPQPHIRAKFDEIYNYYKSIEGKNFNSSDSYKNDWLGKPEYQAPLNLSKMPKTNGCMCYYNADGTPSSCFVTFSTGGIHGAEYNKALYEYDMETYEEQMRQMHIVQTMYPDPIDLKKAKRAEWEDKDGTKHSYPASKFLKSGSTLKQAFYKDFESKKPELFVKDTKDIYKLNPKYVFTSADETNHEDFTSYYPNMLRMLSAFFNKGLGYDRYAEIFDNKEKYGKLMKDKSLSEDEREAYAIQREGTKLILNSASGAGDANFESNIRMNNMIISMRIIGQLFTWRIGQAQTIHGAKITSTNTDGLYSVLDPEINNPILEQEAASINVDIEPEPTCLISKDSNNRVEFDIKTGKIESASGGTLACRMGPNPTKSLAHPAIIDWALTEYLIAAASHYQGISMSTTFDNELGMKILQSSKKQFEPVHLLTMYQNVIASSNGSMRYIFNTTDENPSTPIIMQHYNRVFIMKDHTPGTVHLRCASAKKITDATIKKRNRNKERLQQHDAVAMQVLNANGVKLSDFSSDKEASISKVTGIEDSWYMCIINDDLHYMTQEQIDEIMNNLDYDKYLTLLRDGFEKNWRNNLPDVPDKTKQTDDPNVVENEPQNDQNMVNDDFVASNETTDEPYDNNEDTKEPTKDQKQTNKEPDIEPKDLPPVPSMDPFMTSIQNGIAGIEVRLLSDKNNPGSIINSICLSETEAITVLQLLSAQNAQ